MGECAKCSRVEEDDNLLDAIYGSEIVKICEECAAGENIPIIRKPSEFQLQASNKPYSVRQRLSKLAGIPIKEEKVEDVKPKLNLGNIRPAKNYSGIIESRVRERKSISGQTGLIDNFNWHIQQARRVRKVTLRQVAEVIGESETSLKMIESGDLSGEWMRIIPKLEQYLRINLRKSELNGESERIERAREMRGMPARAINLDVKTMQEITIADLKEIKQRKESLAKEEESEKKRVLDLVWKGIGPREKKVSEIVDREDELVGNDVEFVDGEENS